MIMQQTLHVGDKNAPDNKGFSPNFLSCCGGVAKANRFCGYLLTP